MDHFVSRAELDKLSQRVRDAAVDGQMDPDKKKFGKAKLMNKIKQSSKTKGENNA